MKTLTLLASALFILCASQVSYAQHDKELPSGYYVVVAAFSPDREDLAIKFSSQLAKDGMNARYGYNSERNYWYVYLKNSDNINECVPVMDETRKLKGFEETWIRKIDSGIETDAKPSESVVVETQPTPEPKIEPVEQVASLPDTSAQQPSGPVTLNPEIVEVVHVDAELSEVFLNLYNATNNRQVEGNVKIVDTEKSKLIKEVKGNDYLLLPNPKTTSGQLTLICEAFGYRKVQQEITSPIQIADTAKSYIDLIGPTFVINFDLVRYNKGDIATLYQVFFFNDASIMLPESKFELNSLLQMMQENPGYRIMLHGHTNGNYHGKIIVRGDNKNFFSIDGSKKTTGSAKELSYARAEIIKDYLVDNGIDASRIEVKAWGGKRPIYDKHSANAKKNVRVEVEILEDK